MAIKERHMEKQSEYLKSKDKAINDTWKQHGKNNHNSNRSYGHGVDKRQNIKKMYNFHDKIKMNKVLGSWKIQLMQNENQIQ
jgi:hypothetical protein